MPVTMSQVYAVFDEATHAVMRRAMVVSRGGVVRVEDVETVLCADHPAWVEQCLQWTADEIKQKAQRVASGPAWVPMSNEPALRALLQAAYELASLRGEPVITPMHLLQALKEHWKNRTPPCLSSLKPGNGKPVDNEALVAEVFSGWLQAQTHPTETAQAKLEALARRAAQISSRPCWN
jgi:hypothetical protein